MTVADYPLTPTMRAALDADLRGTRNGVGCFPFVVIVLALAVALIARRPLAELPTFLLLVGACSALLSFGIWAVSAWRKRAAAAAGTYRRYDGLVEIRAEYRRNRTIWRVVAAGTAFTVEHSPGEWVESWFVAGRVPGTLLYSPEARYLFAAWDECGRLVYRARAYTLADNELIESPDVS